MFPPCGNSPVCRGLCRKHYESARQLVKDGRTSWKKLQEAGKAGARTLASDWFLEESKARA
jgi:hypothetical protein